MHEGETHALSVALVLAAVVDLALIISHITLQLGKTKNDDNRNAILPAMKPFPFTFPWSLPCDVPFLLPCRSPILHNPHYLPTFLHNPNTSPYRTLVEAFLRPSTQAPLASVLELLVKTTSAGSAGKRHCFGLYTGDI